MPDYFRGGFCDPTKPEFGEFLKRVSVASTITEDFDAAVEHAKKHGAQTFACIGDERHCWNDVLYALILLSGIRFICQSIHCKCKHGIQEHAGVATRTSEFPVTWSRSSAPSLSTRRTTEWSKHSGRMKL